MIEYILYVYVCISLRTFPILKFSYHLQHCCAGVILLGNSQALSH